MQRIKQWLANLPAFTNPVERQQATILQYIILSIIGLLILILFIVGILPPDLVLSSQVLVILIIVLVPLLGCFFGLWLLRRGKLRSSTILTLILMLFSPFISILQFGFTSAGGIFSLAAPIVIAGFILSRRVYWWIISTILLFFVLVAGLNVFFPNTIASAIQEPYPMVVALVSFSLLVLFFSFIVDRFMRILQESLTESRQRQSELESLRNNQEIMIAERTAELQSSLALIQHREQQLAITVADLQASKVLIGNLSAPIIPVLPRVLVVPMVGSLDSSRAEMLTTTILHEVEIKQAYAVIFDITGTEFIDATIAQLLIRTASAINLLGAQTLLVGMRPEVAQVISSLNVDLHSISAYRDLQEAIEVLLAKSGWQRPHKKLLRSA